MCACLSIDLSPALVHIIQKHNRPLQAENTFLLALDGDVDFKPEAVRLLVDRMRKNSKTGAACGRIHPIGTGNCCHKVALLDFKL